MKISTLLIAAVLASPAAVYAQAPDSIPAAPAPTIKLSGVTGVVQIRTANGLMTVKKGEPMPEIPAGAEIVVVSGEVSVVSGGLTVNAKAGDSFTINTGAAGLTVAVTGGSVAVVDAKGVSKTVAKGESTTAAAVTTTVVTKTETKTETTETKTETPPAETTTVVTTYVFTTSVTQESCTNTVSPSAPCP